MMMRTKIKRDAKDRFRMLVEGDQVKEAELVKGIMTRKLLIRH